MKEKPGNLGQKTSDRLQKSKLDIYWMSTVYKFKQSFCNNYTNNILLLHLLFNNKFEEGGDKRMKTGKKDNNEKENAYLQCAMASLITP